MKTPEIRTKPFQKTHASLAITSQSSGSVKITISQSIRFNPNRASVTYFIVGGGAGGNALWSIYGGNAVSVIPGGAGGWIFNYAYGEYTLRAGSGANGIAIFSW